MSTVQQPHDTAACEHLSLRLVPALDAYECVEPTCRRLFERIECQFCRICRSALPAEDVLILGDICCSCWQEVDAERWRAHHARVRAEIKAVPCPTCGRVAGEKCRSLAKGKTWDNDFHAARKSAAGHGR